MMVDIKLINKYIKRIKIDYPEDDKLMVNLQQFAQEVIKNYSIPAVIRENEKYCNWCSSTEEVEVLICKKCRQGMDDHR